MPSCQEITVPSDIRTEHSFRVFQTYQSKLGQSLPDFMFVYFHFNVPSTEITDLITEMYQMKRFIDIKKSPLSMLLLLLNWFVFSQLYSQ